jgi:hypothetical protein
MRSGYNEPTVMWRMERGDDQVSHAVIAPRPEGAIVSWFVNGQLLGSRDFTDLTDALRWSEQMRAHNWAVGWRLSPE